MNNYKKLETLIGKRSVALIGHVEPDADALCSIVVFREFLMKQFGIKCIDLFADASQLPHYADEILGGVKINKKPRSHYDAAVMMDTPNLPRLGRFASIFEASETKICIDHHATNEHCGKVNIVEICSSTCEIVFRIMSYFKHPISDQNYGRIYAGIITDTGNFSVGDMSRNTFEIAGQCVEHIKQEKIHDLFFASNSPKNMQLLAITIDNMQMVEGGRILITQITKEQALRYKAVSEDYDGIANRLCSIAGVKMVCFVQPRDGQYYVTMRAKRGYDVARVAKHFGGGGHVGAAGFMSYEPLSVIEQQVLVEFSKQIKYTSDRTEKIF